MKIVFRTVNTPYGWLNFEKKHLLMWPTVIPFLREVLNRGWDGDA